MNKWEAFLINMIIENRVLPDAVIRPVVEKYITFYRRNQYDSIPKLIALAKREIDKDMDLYLSNQSKEI